MATHRLLLIDDQPLVLSALARFLEQKGYEVHTASNGREGLDCAMRIRPDLVITDIKMPVMDGRTLVKTLRASADFALLPVIILTDEDEAETRMEGFRLGADDFVSKSTIVDEVEVRVARALERSRSIQAAIQGRSEPQASAAAAASRPQSVPKGATVDSSKPTAAADAAVDAGDAFNLPPLAKTLGLQATFSPAEDKATEPTGPESSPGMQGSLAEIGLASILTLLGSGQKSGVLSVSGLDEHERGQVMMRNGTILRVRLDGEPELRAVDAVSKMITWRQGSFVFSMQDVTARDEVHMPTEHLLMEASRLVDEGP